MPDIEVKPELNEAQEKLRHRMGYIGMVDKRDTLYEARNDALGIIERASTPADAMTATFMLYNTVAHELAKRCICLDGRQYTKGELVDLLFGGSHTEDLTIDFSRPCTWDAEARKLGIDPHEYVWAYEKEGPRKFGGPLNLAEALRDRMLGVE
jgi:hypothetical protein